MKRKKISVKDANKLRKEGRLFDKDGKQIKDLRPYLPKKEVKEEKFPDVPVPEKEEKPISISVEQVDHSMALSELSSNIVTELKRISSVKIQTEPHPKKWKFTVVRGQNKLIKEVHAEAVN
jgi:hypothetical protein